VAADHADVRADGGQPSRAAVEFAGILNRAVFLAVGQVGAVDQPLDQIIAVLSRGLLVEDDLVTLGKKAVLSVSVGAELEGDGVRIPGRYQPVTRTSALRRRGMGGWS